MKHTLFILFLFSLYACNRNEEQGVAPKRSAITETVFASGVLEPDQQYNLTAQTDGYLLQMNIEEGDLVKAGQVVAVVDNPTNPIQTKTSKELLKIAELNTTDNAPAIRQIEANIAIARERLAQDQTQADRYKRLLESNSIAKVEYENAALMVENTKAQIKALEEQIAALRLQAEQQRISQQSSLDLNEVSGSINQVKALVSGKVYRQFKRRGDYVRRGEVIAVIGDANFIYAKLNVDENSINKIRIGQKVTLRLNPQKDHPYTGEVFEILPSFDAMTQSFPCKVRFVDSLQFPIAGTQLEANITIGEKKDVLLIPRGLMGYGNQVQLKRNDSLRTIVPGIISTEWVEVLSGLTEQDELVTIKPKKK